MLDALQSFTEGLPEWLQWFGVMVTAAIPFLEGEVAAAIGVVTGIPVLIAIPAAVIGNVVSVAVVVLITSAGRRRLVRRTEPEDRSPRRQRLRRAFDRYGVPGVSLLGPTILPTQITSAAMVSFGAAPRIVLIWQTVAIVLWTTAFGILAAAGVAVLHQA